MRFVYVSDSLRTHGTLRHDEQEITSSTIARSTFAPIPWLHLLVSDGAREHDDASPFMSRVLCCEALLHYSTTVTIVPARTCATNDRPPANADFVSPPPPARFCFLPAPWIHAPRDFVMPPACCSPCMSPSFSS